MTLAANYSKCDSKVVPNWRDYICLEDRWLVGCRGERTVCLVVIAIGESLGNVSKFAAGVCIGAVDGYDPTFRMMIEDAISCGMIPEKARAA